MSLLTSVKVSTAIVAQGTPAKVYSICCNSDDEDLYIRLIDGGSGGTVKFFHQLDATAGAIGSRQFKHTFSQTGVDFNDGLYLELTKDGTVAANGTTYVNVEYKGLVVG